MALLMPVSALLAGGSKSAIAPCVETSVPENAVRVSRLLAWTGNFLNTEDGALLAGLLRVKQDLPGIHTLFPSSPLGTNYRTITGNHRATHKWCVGAWQKLRAIFATLPHTICE